MSEETTRIGLAATETIAAKPPSLEEEWLVNRPRLNNFITILLKSWDPILISVVETLLSQGEIKLDDHIKRPGQLLPKTFVKMCIDKKIMKSENSSEQYVLKDLENRLSSISGAPPISGTIGLPELRPDLVPEPLNVQIKVQGRVDAPCVKQIYFSSSDTSWTHLPHSVLVECHEIASIGPAFEYLRNEYQDHPDSQQIHNTRVWMTGTPRNIMVDFDIPDLEGLALVIEEALVNRGIEDDAYGTLVWEDWLPDNTGDEDEGYDEGYDDEDEGYDDENDEGEE